MIDHQWPRRLGPSAVACVWRSIKARLISGEAQPALREKNTLQQHAWAAR